MIYSITVLPFNGRIADVVSIEFSFFIVNRFRGFPKQRKIPSLDAVSHSIYLLHLHTVLVLKELGSILSREAYSTVVAML